MRYLCVDSLSRVSMKYYLLLLIDQSYKGRLFQILHFTVSLNIFPKTNECDPYAYIDLYLKCSIGITLEIKLVN